MKSLSCKTWQILHLNQTERTSFASPSCGTDDAGEQISKTRSELLVMNGFLVYGVIISKA